MQDPIRIFVSSPSDVPAERKAVERVATRLAAQFEGLDIKVTRWESGQYFSAHTGFQEQIEEIGSFDIVVGILWSRLGTPLPASFGRGMPKPREGEPYPSGTAFEILEAIELRRQRNTPPPEILVYRKLAPTPSAKANDDEAQEKLLAQRKSVNEFFRDFFSNEEEGFKAAFRNFETLERFEELLESNLRAWLQQQNRLGPQRRWRIEDPERGSPFVGLRAFGAAHRDVFFGRRAEIERARERLAEGGGFLLVDGASGVGKSSLVRAGLLPRMRDLNPDLRVAITRPETEEPILSLAQALFEKGALPELADGDYNDPAGLGRLLASGGDVTPILRALDRASQALSDGEKREARLVILVDQCEALFTSCVSAEEQKTYGLVLENLVSSGRVEIIATLRANAREAALANSAFGRLIDSQQGLSLGPPTPDAFGEIVRGPAEAAGITFERDEEGVGLDEILLREVSRDPDALPLLQFALDELYDKAVHRMRDAGVALGKVEEGEPVLTLTHADYNDFGGLSGAIGHQAEAGLRDVSDEARDRLAPLVRALTVAGSGMVALGRAPTSIAVPDAPTEELVNALLDARILVRGERQSESPGVDDRAIDELRFAHERVLSAWDRARKAVEDAQTFLRVRGDMIRAEARWRDARQPNDLLLPGGLRLAEAESILSDFGAELDHQDPRIRLYVQASGRNARRRQRFTQAAAVVFATVAFAAVWFGYQSGQNAKRAKASDEARILEGAEALRSRTLQAVRALQDKASASLRSGNVPDAIVALADARETVDSLEDQSEKQQLDAGIEERLSVLGTLLPERLAYRNTGESIEDTRVCSSGERVVVRSIADDGDSRLRVYDTATLAPLGQPIGIPMSKLVYYSLSSDGRRLAVSFSSNATELSMTERGRSVVRVYDAESGTVLGQTDLLDGAPGPVKFLEDGASLRSVISPYSVQDLSFALLDNSQAKQVAFATLKLQDRVLVTQREFTKELILPPEGGAFSSDGRFFTVDLVQPRPIVDFENETMTTPRFEGITGIVANMAFIGDGERVVATGLTEAGAAYGIFEVGTGARVGQLSQLSVMGVVELFPAQDFLSTFAVGIPGATIGSDKRVDPGVSQALLHRVSHSNEKGEQPYFTSLSGWPRQITAIAAEGYSYAAIGDSDGDVYIVRSDSGLPLASGISHSAPIIEARWVGEPEENGSSPLLTVSGDGVMQVSRLSTSQSDFLYQSTPEQMDKIVVGVGTRSIRATSVEGNSNVSSLEGERELVSFESTASFTAGAYDASGGTVALYTRTSEAVTGLIMERAMGMAVLSAELPPLEDQKGVLAIYSSSSGEPVGTPYEINGEIFFAWFDPRVDRFFAVARTNEKVFIVGFNGETWDQVFELAWNGITSVKIARSASRVLLVRDVFQTVLLDLSENEASVVDIKLPTGSPGLFDLSPDGTRIMKIDAVPPIRLTLATEGERVISHTTDHTEQVAAIGFLSGGRIFVADRRGDITTWNRALERELRVEFGQNIGTAVASETGELIFVAADLARPISVLDASSGTILTRSLPGLLASASNTFAEMRIHEDTLEISSFGVAWAQPIPMTPEATPRTKLAALDFLGREDELRRLERQMARKQAVSGVLSGLSLSELLEEAMAALDRDDLVATQEYLVALAKNATDDDLDHLREGAGLARQILDLPLAAQLATRVMNLTGDSATDEDRLLLASLLLTTDPAAAFDLLVELVETVATGLTEENWVVAFGASTNAILAAAELGNEGQVTFHAESLIELFEDPFFRRMPQVALFLPSVFGLAELVNDQFGSGDNPLAAEFLAQAVMGDRFLPDGWARIVFGLVSADFWSQELQRKMLAAAPAPGTVSSDSAIAYWFVTEGLTEISEQQRRITFSDYISEGVKRQPFRPNADEWKSLSPPPLSQPQPEMVRTYDKAVISLLYERYGNR